MNDLEFKKEFIDITMKLALQIICKSNGGSCAIPLKDMEQMSLTANQHLTIRFTEELLIFSVIEVKNSNSSLH